LQERQIQVTDGNSFASQSNNGTAIGKEKKNSCHIRRSPYDEGKLISLVIYC